MLAPVSNESVPTQTDSLNVQYSLNCNSSFKPYEAVFISDLHLHPDESSIMSRFNAFIDWAALHTKQVYILGDFFHAWPGDDALDSWSREIAARLFWLSEQQVTIYYMHGNRDFLLGGQFAKLAGMTILTEPTVIRLNESDVLLVHGDRYCTLDKGHQWFRRLTRNALFPRLFLELPLTLRRKMVAKVRQHSQLNKIKTLIQMDVVIDKMLAHMRKKKVTNLIHGHTHKPGLTSHVHKGQIFTQYVLSDWDDNPKLLCYDKTKRFNFVHFY